MYTAHEPQSFEEATSNEKKNSWKQAMAEERNALRHHNTWKLVPKQLFMKPLGCRWVFRVKTSTSDQGKIYKARLVAKGYNQTYGIDYTETYAPVARMSSARFLLAHAVQYGLMIHQMEVKNAFLNGYLHEKVYMEQPEGFVDAMYPNYVCELNRILHVQILKYFSDLSIEKKYGWQHLLMTF